MQERLAQGAAKTGRDATDLTIAASPLVATGRDAAAVSRGRVAARQLLGFLFSTPSQISTTLRELDRTLEAVRLMAQEIERNPSSLVFGRSGDR